jgi:hypothetical protein
MALAVAGDERRFDCITRHCCAALGSPNQPLTESLVGLRPLYERGGEAVGNVEALHPVGDPNV